MPAISIPHIAVDRSNVIRSIGYNRTYRILEVEFKSGSLYRFMGVPDDVYNNFARSSSKGSFFQGLIRGKYKSKKIAKRPKDSSVRV